MLFLSFYGYLSKEEDYILKAEKAGALAGLAKLGWGRGRRKLAFLLDEAEIETMWCVNQRGGEIN